MNPRFSSEPPPRGARESLETRYEASCGNVKPARGMRVGWNSRHRLTHCREHIYELPSVASVFYGEGDRGRSIAFNPASMATPGTSLRDFPEQSSRNGDGDVARTQDGLGDCQRPLDSGQFGRHRDRLNSLAGTVSKRRKTRENSGESSGRGLTDARVRRILTNVPGMTARESSRAILFSCEFINILSSNRVSSGIRRFGVRPSSTYLKNRGLIPGGMDAHARFGLFDRVDRSRSAPCPIFSLTKANRPADPIRHGCWVTAGPVWPN
jgi:hypothetical protein